MSLLVLILLLLLILFLLGGFFVSPLIWILVAVVLVVAFLGRGRLR